MQANVKVAVPLTLTVWSAKETPNARNVMIPIISLKVAFASFAPKCCLDVRSAKIVQLVPNALRVSTILMMESAFSVLLYLYAICALIKIHVKSALRTIFLTVDNANYAITSFRGA